MSLVRGVVWVLVCFCVLPCAEAKEPAAAFKKESKRALSLYAKESYKDAVVAFKKALALLKDAPNRNAELETRKYLVLALHNSQQRDEAVKEYRALKAIAPAFRFDPDEVLPETIAFLTRAVPDEPETVKSEAQKSEPPRQAPRDAEPDKTAAAPPSKPEPAREQTITVAPTTEAPRDLKPAATAEAAPPAVKRWHWYYLTPLGVGQFLAGSPVRGALFLLLQAGFTALNVVGYVLYSRELVYADGTARDAKAAFTGQTMMNVGFFGLLASVVGGTVDGAFLEP
jgi:hypothetical protein